MTPSYQSSTYSGENAALREWLTAWPEPDELPDRTGLSAEAITAAISYNDVSGITTADAEIQRRLRALVAADLQTAERYAQLGRDALASLDSLSGDAE